MNKQQLDKFLFSSSPRELILKTEWLECFRVYSFAFCFICVLAKSLNVPANLPYLSYQSFCVSESCVQMTWVVQHLASGQGSGELFAMGISFKRVLKKRHRHGHKAFCNRHRRRP